MNRLVGSVGSHINHVIRPIGATEPVELGPIKLNFLTSRKLIEVKRRIDRRDGQAVGLGNSMKKVGGNNRTAARHVLDDEVRIPGNMFAEMLGDESCVGVIGAPGGGSRDNCDCFSLIKIGLRWVRPQ